MKKLFVIMSIVAFGLLASTNGCSTTAKQTAYKTAATTQVTVSTAMTFWGDWVAAGSVTKEQEQKVKMAYETYQKAMAIVCDAGAVYSASGTNVTSLNAFEVAVANANTSIADLVALVKTITGK